MKIVQLPTADLVPDARNARTHSKRQIAQIAASITEFGFNNPVLVDEQNTIIAGHGRVMAALKLKLKDVPAVVISHLTPAQRQAYAIADNQLALTAAWDANMLATSVEILLNESFDLSLLGFDDLELESLFADRTEGLTDPDAVPEVPDDPVTKRGDMWLLGRHRIMCGDSTSADVVERLMGGHSADVCFTSPPYAQQRDYKKEILDWDALMSGVFSIAPMKAGANILVNLGLVHNAGSVNLYWSAWLDFMGANGWPLFAWYVWDQGHGMPGNWNGRLAPSHEFVFHFAAKAGQSNKWVDKKPENIKAKKPAGGAFRQKDGSLKPIHSGAAFAQPTKVADSVIRVNRAPSQAAGLGHPATFPTGLCAYIYNSFAKAGDLVFEPFSGAGTSIIACEEFGAECRAIEIAPAYVDVAVKRWQKFTGKKATLESTGSMFPARRKK